MTAALILNQSQAEAVYSAMCVLNNVSADIDTLFIGPIRVRQTSSGKVSIADLEQLVEEEYVSQSAFATAYGLQQG